MIIPFWATKAWGNPFHGLVQDGQLSLPNGQTRAHVQPSSGDCFLLRVPGQPDVSRTSEEAAADTAAGRQWRNYALLSGENHLLYGQALGPQSWIYIAPDASRWQVTCALLDGNKTVANAISGGQFVLGLVVKRFGELGRGPEGYTLSVSASDIGLSGSWQTSTLKLRIEDISSTGAKVVIGIGRTALVYRGLLPEDGGQHAAAFLLLTISGAAGTHAAALSILHDHLACGDAPPAVDQSEVYTEIREYSGPLLYTDSIVPNEFGGNTITELPRSRFDPLGSLVSRRATTHVDVDSTVVVGIVFDASDNPMPVTIRGHNTLDTVGSQSSEQMSGSRVTVYDAENNVVSQVDTVLIRWSGWLSESATYIVEIAGPWGTQQYTASHSALIEWTETLYGDDTSDFSRTTHHQVSPFGTVDDVIEGAPLSGVHYSEPVPLPSAFGVSFPMAPLGWVSDIVYGLLCGAVRLTNKVWLAWATQNLLTELPSSPPAAPRYFHLLTPAGAAWLGSTAGSAGDLRPVLDQSSWQPVSHDTSGPALGAVRCWV